MFQARFFFPRGKMRASCQALAQSEKRRPDSHWSNTYFMSRLSVWVGGGGVRQLRGKRRRRHALGAFTSAKT